MKSLTRDARIKNGVLYVRIQEYHLYFEKSYPCSFYRQCTGKSSSDTGTMYGTCLTLTECQAKSGVANGNCAAGFGVCCTFT